MIKDCDLGALSVTGKQKTHDLMKFWNGLGGKVEKGTKEILFKKRGSTVFRVTPTKNTADEHLSIRNVVDDAVRQRLKSQFNGYFMQKNLNIKLSEIETSDLSLICEMCFENREI